jgi:hypothetical protein
MNRCISKFALLLLVSSLMAAETGLPAGGISGAKPDWDLRLRDNAGGGLGSNGSEVTKTNGVGTMDVVWSRTFTVKANGNCILRLSGVFLTNGYADWYYDMGQFFNDPEVHAEIGAVRKVRERLLQTKRSSFRPDVCVVAAVTDRHYLAHDEAVILYDEVNFNPQGLALAAMSDLISIRLGTDEKPVRWTMVFDEGLLSSML